MNKPLISDRALLRIAICSVTVVIVSFGMWISVILIKMGQISPLPSLDDFGQALTPPITLAIATFVVVYGVFYYGLQRRT